MFCKRDENYGQRKRWKRAGGPVFGGKDGEKILTFFLIRTILSMHLRK